MPLRPGTAMLLPSAVVLPPPPLRRVLSRRIPLPNMMTRINLRARLIAHPPTTSRRPRPLQHRLEIPLRLRHSSRPRQQHKGQA